MNLTHFTDQNRNKAILSMLVEMTAVDGNISPIELKYLRFVAAKLSIPEKDYERTIAQPQVYSLATPASEDERMTILYLLLFAMQADKIFTEKEENLARQYALILGIRPSMVQNLIDVLRKHNHGVMPPGAMLQEIKKYLN